MRSFLSITSGLFLFAGMAFADPPDIIAVDAQRQGTDYRFSVTLAHPDTGWDHYADGWRVELEDGTDLGTRVLAHPHVTEQPFTRSLGGIQIPTGVSTVFVRAKCSDDGWNEDRVAISLE
ncbi:hypothetical protein [Pacificoceanicola onchidii]|uniref:hypothetical protein n=1 Tax=Pacificoceanicola onchidii TaxID=2562685 RepID=UPI0010A6649B|nr:hypothetical protein [Pacificoceanicola onchidii]